MFFRDVSLGDSNAYAPPPLVWLNEKKRRFVHKASFKR